MRSDWVQHANHIKGTTNQHDKKRKGKTRASEGENVQMQYVVDKDGTPVTGYQATQMRQVARSIWTQLASAGIAPRKWMTDIPLTVADTYRKEMQTRFPELALCENGWKADQIAIDYYPSWRSAQAKRKGKTETKEEDNDSDNNSSNEYDDDEAARKIPLKRKSIPIPTPTSKRHKVSEVATEIIDPL